MVSVMSKSKSFTVGLVVLSLLDLSIGTANVEIYTPEPVLDVDGLDYYMAGKPDGPGGATDIPGHFWVQAGPDKVVGKFYNTRPYVVPQLWSSDADDGALLYKVDGIIDEWSLEKAAYYASRGYVHYHELVLVNDDGSPGKLHPDKVVWLKHTAVSSFTLDGGPHPEFYHAVTPGIDYDFIPLGFESYPPTS